MKFYELYINTSCGFCKRALELLEEKKKPFIVTVLDKLPREIVDVLKADYLHATVPIILEHEWLGTQKRVRKVGGFTELFTELNTQDAESTPLEEMNEEQKQKDAAHWEHTRGRD